MKLRLAIVALLLATTGGAVAQQQAPAPAAAPANAAQTEDARLTRFLDRAFDEQASLNPQLLTSLGSREHYDRLNSYTDAHRERELALQERQLAELRRQFDPARLSPAGRLSFRLFEKEVADDRAAFRWRWHNFPVSNNGSPMGSIPVFLINNHRVESVADAEAYVARLREVERVMTEIGANIRHQAEIGIVPPAFNFAPVREDGRRILAGAPFGDGPDMPVFADFKAKVGPAADSPGREGPADRRRPRRADRPVPPRLRCDAGRPWTRSSRARPGITAPGSCPTARLIMPSALRNRPRPTSAPSMIHRLGLGQVNEIHREMESDQGAGRLHRHAAAILRPFEREPGVQISEHRRGPAGLSRRRPRLHRPGDGSGAALVPPAAARAARGPRGRALPPGNRGGRLLQPSDTPDGSRPGHLLRQPRRHEPGAASPQVEAIAYHEGAPGHHFQTALAQELEGVPKFRRFGGYTAYGEGWGLYAEALGKDMGFYREPISEFGMLSTQLWRAIRLVVDTGIHYKRWSREQAIDYFMANGLLSRRDATKEVERYFNNPGQATAYMIGRLKILELRDRARDVLGDRFDIRDFHAVVLENGAVPLDVLEELVDAYIAQRRSS